MSETSDTDAYGPTIGQRLRIAREARGQTLDDVANETRIPIRHLRNIEDSNWEDLPAVTYTVGFARNYANAVGLDGPEIARELRDEIGGIANRSMVSPEIYDAPDPARVPSRGLAWGAAILLVVLVAGWLLVVRPYLTRSQESAEAPAAQNGSAAVPEAPAAPPAPPTPASLAGQPVTLVATADVWFSATDRGANNRRLHYDLLREGARFAVPTDAVRPVIFTTNPQNLRVMIGDQDRGPLAAQRGRMNDQSLKADDLATLLPGPPVATPGAPGAAPAPGTPPQP